MSWNDQIIEEFRANHGVVGGAFEGKPLLLLTHRGAKTGTVRTNPLMYLRDGEDYYVFASMGGAPKHPDWYRNVLANPEVTLEVGDDRFDAVASDVTGRERDDRYAAQASRWPQFAEYQEKTERVIPVVRLHPREDQR